jgi:hypothetical protein
MASLGGLATFLMGRKDKTLCAPSYLVVFFRFLAVFGGFGAQGRNLFSHFLI